MSEPTAFDRAADLLEARTDLSRLESRGTLRIVLKKAGFEPRSVTSGDLSVVLRKLLPAELVARGIEEAEPVSAALAASVEGAVSDVDRKDTPDDVFRRLSS